jgi:iron complex outermembrane receptor protein
VALAWRINNEKFLQNVESLSNLKLRLSYGKTGQQDIGSDYPYQSTYTASYNESRYKFGDTWLTTYRPDGYDPNIKWETTTTYNVGLDWGVLNNRISGSIDYYHRKTKDLLNTIYVPAGSNYTNMITTNIGSMKNDGIEFALNAIPVKTKDLEWSVNANFTWNKSKITKLNTIDTDANYVKTGNAGGTGKYLQIHKVGETPYTFFLLRQAYDDNGNPLDGKYLDAKGNVTTSEEDANKYVTGKSSLAPYFYGLSTKLLYKNWDLGINGHGSIKNYVYNYVAASDSYDDLYSSQGTSGNILCSTLKTNFTQQRLYTDYFLENASFFRIDNITLGYTFSKLWNTQSNLRLSFAVQNVCTFTGYSGVDPEIYSGIDTNTYQHPREYILSLNMNF